MEERNIILVPAITEKGTALTEKNNKYSFKVRKNANKVEIKGAIEKIFKVKVTSVNTMTRKGKKKRVRRVEGKTPDWKKAIVTLRSGDKIDVL